MLMKSNESVAIFSNAAARTPDATAATLKKLTLATGTKHSRQAEAWIQIS